MSDFKLGDLVKRIADPAHDCRYMVSGEVYTVTGLPTNDCESVQVNGFADYWNIDYFELYKPQQIIDEAEPTELEEAYAHIESLESALGDAVREIFSLKHQLIAKAANTCLGVVQGESQQFKPISEMTYEDWLELYNSENSVVFWDSLGRELTLEYLWKDSDTCFTYAFEEDSTIYSSEGVNIQGRGQLVKRIK